MKVSKKLMVLLLLVGQVLLLSGCGTLTRGDSYKSSYRGFDQDKKIASNPYCWIFSFGIAPVFFIASMPVDIVVDTILYPYDRWQYDKTTKALSSVKPPFKNTQDSALQKKDE